MQKIILFLFVGLLAFACSPQASEENVEENEEVTVQNEEMEEEEAMTFPADSVTADSSMSFHGLRITEEGAIPASQLVSEMAGKEEIITKLQGPIEEACQVKGCWMTMKLADDQQMRVRFKDYGFFVPKNAGGKVAVVEGRAFTDTTSVDELRHYAEDAGMPQEEIEKITEPEISVAFEAVGVIIKDETGGAE